MSSGFRGQSAVWLRLYNNTKGAISIPTESLCIGEKVQALDAQEPVRTSTPALALATLFALAGTLGAQTAETQPEVVFHFQILQAERAATDKLAAERVTLSKADFNANETINVHILALGGPTRSKLATFRRGNRL